MLVSQQFLSSVQEKNTSKCLGTFETISKSKVLDNFLKQYKCPLLWKVEVIHTFLRIMKYYPTNIYLYFKSSHMVLVVDFKPVCKCAFTWTQLGVSKDIINDTIL